MNGLIWEREMSLIEELKKRIDAVRNSVYANDGSKEWRFAFQAAIAAVETQLEQLTVKEQEMSKNIEGTPLKFEEWYALNFGEVIPGVRFYMSALKHAYECGVAVEREACAKLCENISLGSTSDEYAYEIRARGE